MNDEFKKAVAFGGNIEFGIPTYPPNQKQPDLREFSDVSDSGRIEDGPIILTDENGTPISVKKMYEEC